MLLLIVGVGAIALAIVQSESPHWTRSELLTSAATGATALIGFVAWTRIAKAPLVDLHLLRNRTYTFVNLATLAFGIAFSMMFFGSGTPACSVATSRRFMRCTSHSRW